MDLCDGSWSLSWDVGWGHLDGFYRGSSVRCDSSGAHWGSVGSVRVLETHPWVKIAVHVHIHIWVIWVNLRILMKMVRSLSLI